MADNEPNYERSAADLDLEARQERGNENPDLILSTYGPLEDLLAEQDDEQARDFKVEGNKTDAFLATDEVYVNYGIPQNKAYRAESGPEKEVEDVVYGNTDGNDPEDEADDDEADDDDEKAEKPVVTQPPAKKATASPSASRNS